jgi:cation-transporting P-type ATPase 13A2
VELPTYLEFIVLYLTHPFSLMTYFTCLIYFFLQLTVFALILFFSMFLTANINFFLSRHSLKKMKQIAERSFKVQVLRNGEFVEVDSSDVVPGDIYMPADEVPCDSIVIGSDLFVSEVGYSGENTPIAKMAPPSEGSLMKSEHWIL